MPQEFNKAEDWTVPGRDTVAVDKRFTTFRMDVMTSASVVQHYWRSKQCLLSKSKEEHN